MKKNIVINLIIALTVSAVTSIALISYNNSKNGSTYFYPKTTLESVPVRSVSYSSSGLPDFTEAVESSVKAVVHVKVVKRGIQQTPYSLFDFFFGYGQPQMPREQIGSGSGVIISQDGYIVTNNHVIDGADEIEVTLENNRSFKATLIGADSATDIALLKIDAQNLPFLVFGDSDKLKLGEWVLAIGNPYNLRSTVTAGIVSAKARSMPSMSGDFRIEAFIQTDAAVNPGNSGGALINTSGELVGINTAIASKTGAFSGYSFAVPTSIVRKIVEDIIDFGVVKRAFLGITMQNITEDLIRENNLKDSKGVYVVEVTPSSAADKAGIKSGDIILSINGAEVNSSAVVQEQISRFRPKDRVNVKVLRSGRQKDISVVLESRVEEGFIAKSSPSASQRGEIYRLFGAELVNATPDQIKDLNLRGGVEVVGLADGKFKDSGIEKGFIITHINQMPIRNIRELQSLVQRSRRSILLEGVYPDGRVAYYGMGL